MRLCRLGGVVLALPRISSLNDEITPVAIQARPVEHIVLSIVEVDSVPMGHEPVFVFADEQVGVPHAKEGAVNSLPGAETGTDQLDQLILAIFAAEDILMGPRVPVGDGFPPRRAADQVGNLQVFQPLTLLKINSS